MIFNVSQMNAVADEPDEQTESQGGPMWGRFFDSIGNDDTESVMSGSHSQAQELNSVPSLSAMYQQSPQSEVHPNDSASVVDDTSNINSGYPIPGSVVTAPPPMDDGTYVFKFRTPSGRTHRFQSRHDDIEILREIVAGKLATDPFFTDVKVSAIADNVAPPDPIDFTLSYTDEDGDSVLITSDHNVTDAVTLARREKLDRVVLFVQGGRGWAEAGEKDGAVKAAVVAAAAEQEEKAVEISEATLPEGVVIARPSHPHGHADQGDLMGIPKDMLLPASIGALAVAITAIFTIHKLSGPRY